MADDSTIQNMVSYSLGHADRDGVAILFGYATSQEKLSKGDIDTFVIGMTRENAIQLAEQLLKHAKSDPPASGRHTVQ